MRVWITKLISIFILVSSVIWPALSYSHLSQDQSVEFVQNFDNHMPVNSDNDVGCDHCCHMSAHFLGCFLTSQNISLSVLGQQFVISHNNYFPGISAPPYRPPIA